MTEGKVDFFDNSWGKITIRASTPEGGGEVAFVHIADIIEPADYKQIDEHFTSIKYKALVRRYKDQPDSDCFAQFPWRHGDTWEAPYAELASMAKHEEWNFKSDEFRLHYRQHFPILTNYLNYTFLRAQELHLVSFSEDSTKACFNTGLQTEKDKDIYATFYRQRRHPLRAGDVVTFELTRNEHGWKAVKVERRAVGADECGDTWVLNSFEDSYSEKLKHFPILPTLPTYITDASDLVFDVRLEINVNLEHILEERDSRLPALIRSNKRLAISAIEGAVKSLKAQIVRNYKIAIPHWHNGRVQLLLPLKITSDEKADLALIADKDRERNIYRIRTVLPMDKAFINARLITRPDRDWLDP